MGRAYQCERVMSPQWQLSKNLLNWDPLHNVSSPNMGGCLSLIASKTQLENYFLTLKI